MERSAPAGGLRSPALRQRHDVIVVGYGIAGACAAIEAREAGAKVLVLERASGRSGSTMMSSGHFYLGGATAVQTACGFEDSAEALAAYWTAVTRKPDKAKIEIFAHGSAAHFDWLEARGVPFDRSYFPTKAVIQHGRECLIWTANEKVWPFREQARPAPRGHKVAFVGEEGGGGLALDKLAQHAERIGVEIRYDMQVEDLITEGERIMGVRARHFGERAEFRGAKGVVLAGGGFGRNEPMVKQYLPRFTGTNMVGGPYDDGVVINLGISAGGAVEHMDGLLITSPIYPPEQLVKGILVNRDGKRFIAEDSYHTRTSMAIADQPEGIGYLILDQKVFTYPAWSKLANQKLIDGFSTIAEMERELSLPSGALQRTMAAYNDEARSGRDPEFHKHPDWVTPLDAGPWAAFDFSFGRAVYNAFTLGGLRISADAAVLSESGRAIPGLYAAGACASMLAHDSWNYASGISLSSGSFFGRRAGATAFGRN